MPDGHILNRFAEAMVANMQATLNQIDHAAFDAAAVLLADPKRRVFAVGGRITHAMADYFTSLMMVVRPEGTLLSDNSSTWPPALLACHIEVPLAWDSTVTLMVLVETLLAAVQDLTWGVTEGRMPRLEELYARTRFFRRHR